MKSGDKQQIFTWIFFLAAAGGVPAAIGFVIKSNSAKPIFLGLSAARLVIFAGLLLLIATFSFLAVWSAKGKLNRWLEFPLAKPKYKVIATSLSVLVALFAVLSLLPNYRWGDTYQYVANLLPIFWWGLWMTIVGLIGLLISQLGSHPDFWATYWEKRRGALLTGLAVTGLMVLVLIANISLKILDYKEDFWYGTGVPLLAWQAVSAVFTGFALVKALQLSNKRKDILLFFLIWGITAIVWAAWPYKENFNLSTPRAPNFERYPVVDAAYYDIGSQFALIGEGIYGGVFTDRPLYMVFLFLLHLVVGQNFEWLANLQAAIFAIFPALIYLIGKDLHSREAGVTAAMFISFRGINSLVASPWINNSHLKNLLVDVPTAIALAVFTVLVIRALKRKRWPALIWASGALGLAIMLRTHTVILLSVVFLAAIILLWKQKFSSWILGGVTLAIAVSVTLLPWGFFNGVSPITFFQTRWNSMFEQRYIEPGTVIPQRPDRARFEPPFQTLTASIYPSNTLVEEKVPFQIIHFIHNLIIVPLSLPDTLVIDDIRHVVKDETFWLVRWKGDISPIAAITLSVCLLFVALGVGSAFNKNRSTGLMPFLVMLAYFAANAVARTSGGRYLVPVDWVIYLYFAIGCVELGLGIKTFFGQLESPIQETPIPPVLPLSFRDLKLIKPLAGLLALGLLVPIIPKLKQPIYTAQTKEEVVSNMVSSGEWKLTIMTPEDIFTLMETPYSVALHGRVLYPIFFHQDVGLPLNYTFAQRIEGYPRMVFKIIGPKLDQFVILPSYKPPPFPDGVDAIVLGCQVKYEIQALAVILPDQQIGYMREPPAPFHCPVPIPVCDNNEYCWNP